MNNLNVKNALRFFFLALLQVLVFKQFSFQWTYAVYFIVFIYPIFIILMPFRFPKPLLIFLAFILGMIIDVFYNSPGVHASACVFSAFIRPTLLSILKPQGDYDNLLSPTISHYGFAWFSAYAGILLFLHLLFYFSVEAFTFVYIGQILLKTLASFVVSFFFVLIYQLIFNPK